MLKVEIISPAGVIFEGQCQMAVIPSVAGEIGVMEDHEAFVANLNNGKVKIYNNAQNLINEFEVLGGFAKIDDGKLLTVLVD